MSTRREFLTAAAATVASISFGRLVMGQATMPASAPATTPADNGKKVGWAVVGIGKLTMGQILPAFANAKKSKLVGLVTGHPEKVRGAMDTAKVDAVAQYNYQTFEKMAENPEIECVYIVLPNSMHAEYTIRALKAGKHVLCEKPMANSVDEAKQMIQAAKDAKRKLMIAYRVHFEPHNRKMIEICKGTTNLGKIKTITTDHCFNIGRGAWRTSLKMAGGGSLVDVGIYGLNACRYLTGEEPVEVSAQVIENKTDPRFADIEEGMVWTMRFPSGVLTSNTTSYNAKSVNHHRLMFENGWIDMEPATGYHGIKVKSSDNQAIAFPDMDQFAAEMDHLSECVMEDKTPITPGEEGLQDHVIMAALYESARMGKAVKLG